MSAERLDRADADAAPVLDVWPGEIVDTGRRRIHIRSAPPADGAASADREPAVLVHGLGGASTNWTDLMGLLRDRLDAVAPDLPGFGWSPPAVDGDYSVRGHAAAIVDLLESMRERFGGRPVHLMGNSLGGAVATRVAALRPDLVATLTLVSPALPVLRPRRTTLHFPALATPWLGEQLTRRLGRVSVERRVRATVALCFADPSSVPAQRMTEAVEEARRRATLGYDGEALLRSLRGLMTAYLERGPEALWRLAARVEAPTLLVYGLRDRLVDPRSSARAARTFSDARVITLPTLGHVAQMEAPEVVAAAVREHLDAAAGRRTRRGVSRRPPSDR